MKPKKNPKADLNKNSSLYFVIGLCVILFVSWRAIEWKTYEASDLLLQKLNVDDDDDEEVPLTSKGKLAPIGNRFSKRKIIQSDIKRIS